MRLLLQIKMDEEEIDSWYEEEKQKYVEQFAAEIEKLKNHESAEKAYNDKLNKLIQKYNKLMLEKLQNKKNGKLNIFLSKIKRILLLKKNG